jgi:dCTP deaminase
MILTDREIQIALECGQIKIAPVPDVSAFSSTSVDLTLGDKAAVWQAESGITLHPGRSGYSYGNIKKFQSLVNIQEIELKPQAFILAWTREEVDLPQNSRIAARVEGKSSMARIGIGIHCTAPTIHAGFRGPIQLEIFNFGPHSIGLDPGMRICQLILEQTFGTPSKGYGGMFMDQKVS